jgi:hypothetical protein
MHQLLAAFFAVVFSFSSPHVQRVPAAFHGKRLSQPGTLDASVPTHDEIVSGHTGGAVYPESSCSYCRTTTNTTFIAH